MERDVTKLFETSLIYPCSKFNYDQVVAIRSVKDGEVYLCGAALLNEKKPVHSTIDHCQIDHCALITAMHFVTHGNKILFNNNNTFTTGLLSLRMQKSVARHQYHKGVKNPISESSISMFYLLHCREGTR